MSLVELLSRRIVSCFSSHSDVYNVCLNASTTPIMAMGCQQCLPLIIEKQWDKAKNTAMLCEDQSFWDLNSMHCIVVSWYYCKKKTLQKRFCQFSALCVIVLVFFYYTILSYTTMVKGCVLCLVRTQRSCAWLGYLWGVAAVGNDGSERLSFWLSNIQASVCCYPHGSDFTRKLPIFLQQRFYNSVCLSWGLFRAL